MTPEPVSVSQPSYRSYLLRLWEIDSDGQRFWRVSLQDAHTGDRLGFSGLEQLCDYLRHLTAGSQNGPGVPGAGQTSPPGFARPEARSSAPSQEEGMDEL
jgi:hypothetical protein